MRCYEIDIYICGHFNSRLSARWASAVDVHTLTVLTKLVNQTNYDAPTVLDVFIMSIINVLDEEVSSKV